VNWGIDVITMPDGENYHSSIIIEIIFCYGSSHICTGITVYVKQNIHANYMNRVFMFSIRFITSGVIMNKVDATF